MPSITFQLLPVALLDPNPDNPREALDGIPELASSVRTNGVLQPLIVNARAGQYVITDGHRRLEAARLAGLDRVPCLVTENTTEQRVLTTMLATSLNRELSPLEQAHAFDQLRTVHGMTVTDIAHATGYLPAFIRSRLLLLDLPADAQALLEDEQLTLGQATDLARQVKVSRTGSTSTKTSKAGTSTYFTNHPLSYTARLACELAGHSDTRRLLGGVACPACFEAAIRADERARQLTRVAQ